MQPPLILGIGEILWDLLPAGRQLGGAPANFAWHATQLGAQALVVSGVGDDADGRAILAQLQKLRLDTRLINILPSQPTGTVSVQLDAGGQPTYTIHTGVAWDALAASDDALRAAATADGVCFGSLAQRTPHGRTHVQRLVAASRPDALRIFDINLRQHFWNREVIDSSLQLANVLKLNDDELVVLAKLLDLPGDTSAQLERLASRYHLDVIALTRGSQGSAIWRQGRLHTAAGQPVAVADTIGAGDAYCAALAMGLLAKLETDQILDLAMRTGAYVCTRPGATPILPARLRLSLAAREST